MLRLRISVSCFFIYFMMHPMYVGASDLPRIPLQISHHMLSAEVANTQRSREQGLMFRKALDENTGMLFVFPESAYYGMWMKNTMIPLSVAFIDEKGVIINIADMQPYSLTAHYSARPAKYALEMYIGWFACREIYAGSQIVGLEHVPAAH